LLPPTDMSPLKREICLEICENKVFFTYKHVLKDVPLDPIPITDTTRRVLHFRSNLILPANTPRQTHQIASTNIGLPTNPLRHRFHQPKHLAYSIICLTSCSVKLAHTSASKTLTVDRHQSCISNGWTASKNSVFTNVLDAKTRLSWSCLLSKARLMRRKRGRWLQVFYCAINCVRCIRYSCPTS